MQKKELISEKLKMARNYEEEVLLKADLAPKQAFHVCAPVGWLNDPNGFSLYNGEYHLFFQYHPYSVVWGPMHWGHVKTKDFIKWEQLACALAPDTEYDGQGCFSGSAVEWNGKHVLVYTGVIDKIESDGTHSICQTQCVAIGDGNNYEKNLQNPVITPDSLPEGSSLADFRDSKAWVDGDYIYTVVGSRAKDGSGQIPLYRTKDLENWEFISIIDSCNNEYGKMWECPDFFPLNGKQVLIISPQEVQAANTEFHNGNNTACFIGNYDTELHKFTREKVQTIDYGLDFYAPQTVETEDGRRIMIGWLQSWDNHLFPHKFGWSGMMSIPRELRIEKGRLCQVPIKEIANYYTDSVSYTNLSVQNVMKLDGVCGRYNDLNVHIHGGDYKVFRIQLACGGGKYTSLIYDKEKNTFTMDREFSGLTKDVISTRTIKIIENQESIKIRVVMDHYSVEVFINDGQQVLSMLIFTDIEADGIEFVSEGCAVVDIERHEIAIR
ncbi:MAG: sucrose-6-phosphate hydrolase [Anaerocolumna sp.]|jgi:beta-fructofuranosidase|nr:sucrose-6-phosphate hydrolase [Anaerocolumna sp.]